MRPERRFQCRNGYGRLPMRSPERNTTPTDLSLFKPKNGLDNGGHFRLGGLTEGERTGRPRRMSEKQVEAISRALRNKPSDVVMRVNLWDGKTLSAWIAKTYGIQLGVRQCQRLFRQLEFRLRKPRPVLFGVCQKFPSSARSN